MLALLLLLCLKIVVGLPTDNPEHDKRLLLDATHDYIVVGGGTGGLALVNRLAAHGTVSVALIEAGRTYYQASNILMSSTPAGDTGASASDVNPLVDWGFITQPQADAERGSMHYARGKCLGGR
jgi:choline dehydrogenase